MTNKLQELKFDLLPPILRTRSPRQIRLSTRYRIAKKEVLAMD